MYRHRLSAFEQEIVTIHPGEYFATRDDFIVSTVLGSCVAVALCDARGGAGGLNHFMLPGEFAPEELTRNPNAKYGMHAMELLINDLMKLGVPRGELLAKVFGGAAVLRLSGGGRTRIPRSNVDFAFEYLAKEGIPVLASDVGGRDPRKIFLYPRSGKVLLKRIARTQADLVEREEERYLDTIRSGGGEGEIVLFGEKK